MILIGARGRALPAQNVIRSIFGGAPLNYILLDLSLTVAAASLFSISHRCSARAGRGSKGDDPKGVRPLSQGLKIRPLIICFSFVAASFDLPFNTNRSINSILIRHGDLLIRGDLHTAIL